jgi:hypothetical protein
MTALDFRTREPAPINISPHTNAIGITIPAGAATGGGGGGGGPGGSALRLQLCPAAPARA